MVDVREAEEETDVISQDPNLTENVQLVNVHYQALPTMTSRLK